MMRRKSLPVSLAMLTMLLWPNELAKADPNESLPKPGSAWGAGGKYQKLYEKGSRAKVTGKVMSMSDLLPGESEAPGVQVKLDLGNGEEMNVHLGPRWFILQQDLDLTQGQPLVVEGIAISLDHHPAIVANEVSQGERKVILRELSGAPKWPVQEVKPEK